MRPISPIMHSASVPASPIMESEKPVSSMKTAIAFQKACRQGGCGPREFVQQEFEAAKKEIKEFAEALEKSAEEAAATLSDHSNRLDARVRLPVLEKEVARLGELVVHLRGDRDQAESVLGESKELLKKEVVQIQPLREHVRQMEQKVREVPVSGDQKTAFIQDVGRRGAAYIGQQYRV